MRVHQPGGHLMRGGRPHGRGLVVGADEAAPDARSTGSRVRTSCARSLAIVSLLGATAVALAPPYLVGRAVDEVQTRQHAPARLVRRRVRRRRRARDPLHLRADLLHRLDGRADARRPAQPALPAPAAAVARLLRAEPRRRDHQPADERRRGARPARHRRRHVARPEHADAGRHGRHPLLPRLAARARDARP